MRPGVGVHFDEMCIQKPKIPESHVSNVIAHPLFNISRIGHDIALIHLEKPLEHFDTVFLYAGHEDRLVSTQGFSSGFGTCGINELCPSRPMRVKKKTMLDRGLINTPLSMTEHQLQHNICSSKKDSFSPGDSY